MSNKGINMLFSSALRPIAVAVVGLSLCFGTAPAMANPCVAGMQGCVLPVADLPPPVEAAAPGAVAAPGRGLGFLLPLLGATAALIALLLLLDDDDNDNDEPEPVSP